MLVDTLPGNTENKGGEALIPEMQISAPPGVHRFSYRCVGVSGTSPTQAEALERKRLTEARFKKMDPVESNVPIHKAMIIKSKCAGRREREREKIS